MLELIKNIGLGLFVNGSFALMNFDFKPQSFIITAFSVGIMAICILMQRRKRMNEIGLNIIAGVSVILFAYTCYLFYKQNKSLKDKTKESKH
ncbi:hypothetical protein PAI75_001721 [Campylobacter coli]|nr:hypothetical protein [Campylobacter coli]